MCKCRVDVSFHDPESEVEEVVFADNQMEVEKGLKQLEKEKCCQNEGKDLCSIPSSSHSNSSANPPTVVCDVTMKATDGPKLSLLRYFPFHLFGDRKRNFQPGENKIHSLLDDRFFNDAALCFVCRFFRPQTHGTKIEFVSFVSEGFTNYKKAT